MLVTEQIGQWISVDFSRGFLVDTDHRYLPRSDPPNGYPPCFISARSAADISRYLPWVVDFHLIGNFSRWQSYLQSIPVLLAQKLKLHIMSTQQRKRLRKNSVASLSDISELCDEKVEEITVPQQFWQWTHWGNQRSVNTMTKCWLFSTCLLKVLQKLLEIFVQDPIFV